MTPCWKRALHLAVQPNQISRANQHRRQTQAEMYKRSKLSQEVSGRSSAIFSPSAAPTGAGKVRLDQPSQYLKGLQ